MFKKMLRGEFSNPEIAQILTEMAQRGETVSEILDAVIAMREVMTPVKGHEDAIDNCGTGGSGLSRINTSTIAAFVIAGGGVKVAKHGNRASSGRCGSFDVLEALGVRIELGADEVEKCLSEVGIGFMFAPIFHPAMMYVGPVRKELGIRTIFNLIGPLANPAGVKRQVIGVSDPFVAEKMVTVLKKLGHEKVLVVCGEDSLDEITVTGKSRIFDFEGEREFVPKKVYDEIGGGSVEENARDFLGVLSGEIVGAKRDIVVVNSAVGFLVADKVSGLEEGIEFASEVLDRGKAKAKFEEYASLIKKL